MIGSPMRFQLVVAALAIGGALMFTESQGPRPASEAVFAFQDRSIDESSGLVVDGSTVLTTNDSGDGPVVYVVDRSTGETVGRTTYTPDQVVDVEALAAGPDHTLWVGDIGDNAWSRSSVAAYALPMPGPGDRTVDAERYDLVYQGRPRDAEALLVHPVTGRLHVVSKGFLGGQMFVAPRRLSADEPNVLRPVADVGGLVTDGAFFPDGSYVALRSYQDLTVLATDGWRKVQGMRLPDQAQGEGLAMAPGGDSVLLSSEGARSEVVELLLNEAIVDRVAEPAAAASTAPSTEPSSDSLPPTEEQAGSDTSVDDGEVWQVVVLAGVTLAVVGGVLVWMRKRPG